MGRSDSQTEEKETNGNTTVDRQKKMISEIVNKKFMVVDDEDCAVLATSPPNSPPKALSPIANKVGHQRRSSSLSKGQLEIRKVYDKIAHSAIYNVQQKIIEKNQKALQLSNDESILSYYFKDWLDVMEDNTTSIPLVKKKDSVSLDITMYDIDDYPLHFPLNLLDSGDLHDDYVKFSVTISIPVIHQKKKTFIFLEDGLVHLMEPSDFVPPVGFISESSTFKHYADKFKVIKLLQKISKTIQEFNIDKTYFNTKGGSFYFCREIASLFSEESNLKHAIPDSITKCFKNWNARIKRREEEDEEEYKIDSDEFYKKNEVIPMDDLSKLLTLSVQTKTEQIKRDLVKPSAYEVIYAKLQTNMDFPLYFVKPKKNKTVSFETYAEFNTFLQTTYPGDKLRELKQEHPLDYLYLKILDRKFWISSMANSVFDTLISDVDGRFKLTEPPVFPISQTLLNYFGDIQSQKVDFNQLRLEKQGKAVKVLTLDGGGMRGLVLIEQLRQMEKKTGRKICELFDIVAGTSTGAIIAFFIEAGYDMDTVRSKYLQMGREIFNLKTRFRTLTKAIKFLRGKSWYETRILEKYFIKESGGMDLYSASKTKPYTFVCGTIKPDKVQGRGSPISSKFTEQFPFIFRTYFNPHLDAEVRSESQKLLDPYSDYMTQSEYDGTFYAGTTFGRGVRLVDALRASTAAPIFFDGVFIGNDYFSDGGLVANNPTVIALHEAMSMYMGHNKFLFVSLGTGKKRKTEREILENSMGSAKKKSSSSFSSESSMDELGKGNFLETLAVTATDLKLLIDLVTSSEKIHAQMLSMVRLLNERDVNADISYYRFDPPDLGHYDLDCVVPSVIEEYEKKTLEYVNRTTDFEAMCKRLLDN